MTSVGYLLVLGMVVGYGALVVLTLQWVLALKKETSSAIAWSFLVTLLPFVGMVLFFWFGWDRVHRPLRRILEHREQYQQPTQKPHAQTGLVEISDEEELLNNLGWLAQKLNGYSVLSGNQVTLFHETEEAYQQILQVIREAEKHLHVEYYILQADATGQELMEELGKKAREGVEVRLLYDFFGSFLFRRRLLNDLQDAGGQVGAFLSPNVWRRRFQMNLRNHRKMIIADGNRAVTGGMNIGGEYLGKDDDYGYWRDTNLLLEGPAVACLQCVFLEDWHFATDEYLDDDDLYIPDVTGQGSEEVQIIASGPDQHTNILRGVVYGAITQARHRIWITSPYFIPDQGLMDALQLALRMGLDVKLLIPNKADTWMTWYATRYFLRDLLPEGIEVYQYNKGYMHAKGIIIDDVWALVGSANFDNRSMHLNFEISCAIHSPHLIQELARAFEQDLKESTVLLEKDLANLPFYRRALENFSRLFAPIL